MAITAIELAQDNLVGSVNAMAVHSPLVFLVDVEYNSIAPDYIYAELLLAGQSLIIARCIYVTDISATVRRFKFTADEIIRSYMPEFDDFVQSGGSVVEATNISRSFDLVFKSDLGGTIQQSINIDAVHCARQIGQNQNLSDITANSTDVYIGAPNKPVYVYFYNTESGLPSNLVYALDYDDNFFIDYDDSKFTLDNL